MVVSQSVRVPTAISFSRRPKTTTPQKV